MVRSSPIESTSDMASSDATPHTVFRFAAGDIDLEFAGPEDFVDAQVERFRGLLENAVGIESNGKVEMRATGTKPKPKRPGETLESFYSERPVRDGRGSIQDRILLFIYFMDRIQSRSEVSARDITHCFQQLDIETPKNLHNTLGLLKRNRGFLGEGSKRGLYCLSPKGRQYVESRFKPA